MPYKDDEQRKAKQREYSKNWYERNKKQHQAGVKKNKREGKKRWIEFKGSKKCSHCGAQHAAIIDFHHVIKEDKKSVFKLAANRCYKAAIQEAEEKCIPLCANCHRIFHWEEREKKSAKKALKRSNHGAL
jgi:predicted HNH restriction endonuclease